MIICYCLNSIINIGGIERATIAKANALSEVDGYKVYICVTDHKKSNKVNLNDKITLIDLNICYYRNDWKSKLYILYGFIVKRWKHKNILSKYLKKINPDIVISVGQCEKFFLPFIKGKWKTIREFHYDKLYRIRGAKSLLSKIFAYVINFFEFNFILNKYDKIVLLTNEDLKNNWKNKKYISVIPNILTLNPIEKSDLNKKKVISVGRLVNEKRFISLINIFSTVLTYHPDWVLEIYGEGELKQSLQNHINQLSLENNIFLKGNTNNILAAYANASVFCLTSKFEGWGLVIAEAMSIGLPVISYNCPYGPREIIDNNINGFLIPEGHTDDYIKKLRLLIEDDDLRTKIGKNAFMKSKKYYTTNIIPKWIELFNEIKSKNPQK